MKIVQRGVCLHSLSYTPELLYSTRVHVFIKQRPGRCGRLSLPTVSGMWHYFFVRGFLLQSPCRLLPLLLLLFLLLLAPLASDAFSFTDRAARCNHHVKFYASSNALQECAGKRRAPPFVGGAVGAVDRLVFRHPGDGGVSALASAGVGESAALPEDARESRGEEDGLLSLEEARALLPAPPTGLGARRRADKEANWFKTYLYGPIDPRRGMRADSAAQKETQQQQVQSTLEALRLAETKRPPGLRWKLLEDLRVGTQVLRAAEAAAQRTAERIAASATVCAAPKKKRRLSKAVPTHVVLRRAALRAAAEAVEKNLLEEEEAARREAERGSPLDLLSGGGAESSSSFPDSSLQQPGSARRVYAQALRSLLSRRREERASEEGQKSLSFAATPPAALGGGGEESSSASGAPSEERFVSLLDALTPREGTMLSYSAALLAAQLTASAGFDETVEVHVQMRRGKAASGSSAPRLQGFVTLPHGVVPGGGLTEAGGPQAQLGGAAAAAEDKDSPPAFPAASIRGKKKGGLWRRRRGIAVLVNDDEQREQARAAGGQRQSRRARGLSRANPQRDQDSRRNGLVSALSFACAVGGRRGLGGRRRSGRAALRESLRRRRLDFHTRGARLAGQALESRR